MEAKKRIRLIGSKSFYKMVFKLTIPIMVQNMISSLVNFLDNVMVGQVGTEQMSGVAISNQLIFVFNLAMFGAMSGIGIFTAQFFGAKNDEGVRHTLRAKFYIGAILLILFGAAALWKGEFLISLFLQAGDAADQVALTLSSGHGYLNIMLVGLIPFVLSQIYSSTLRESGETMLPMKAGIVAVATNLLFNYILIFGHFGAPRMGVAGAAVASVISRFIEMGIIMFTAHRHLERYPFLTGIFRSLRIPRQLLGDMLKRGTPLLMNEFLWSLAMAAIQQCYSTRGLSAVAAININSTVFNLFANAYFALGSSIAIIIGQLLGAGKREEARETDYQLIAFAVAVGTFVGLIAFAFAPFFPQFYNTTDEVKKLATYLLRISACTMPLVAFNHSCYFTMRSGGKTMITFFFDSFYMMVLVYPFAFAISRLTDMPVTMLYLCVALIDIIKAIVGFVLVRKGVWIQTIVQKNEAKLQS